ncbi:hypothetical protein ANTPLA_LOCUS590 [Anthophora plagiata]
MRPTGFRFSEGCRRPGNGASHLASCPNYHFVAKLRLQFISTFESPANTLPAPFPSCLSSFLVASKGLRTEVGSETRRQSEEKASGVILQENVT